MPRLTTVLDSAGIALLVLAAGERFGRPAAEATAGVAALVVSLARDGGLSRPRRRG